MSMLEIIFWLCVLLVVYTYIIYPVIIGLMSRVAGRPIRSGDVTQSVSVVIAAHNEEANIARRIVELRDMIQSSNLDGELLVVSDGSTDRTAEIARNYAGDGVRVIVLTQNQGKAAAINAACGSAKGEIIVLADARQTWAPDALVKLLRNFADPTVGAVTGDLVLESSPGVVAGVGLYWRFEKWLRHAESLIHSTVGVTGAIAAVRKELFCPIPQGTVLDDVYWPMRVAMQHKRVVHEPAAKAYDRLPSRTRDEFRRKVRTLSANWQLIVRLPETLLPWRNPLAFQFISHKFCRLLVPWALIAMLGIDFTLNGLVYEMALVAQFGFYVIATLGLWQGVGARWRIVSAASSFVVLNAAAWLGFWVWLLGRTGKSWRKVSYNLQPAG